MSHANLCHCFTKAALREVDRLTTVECADFLSIVAALQETLARTAETLAQREAEIEAARAEAAELAVAAEQAAAALARREGELAEAATEAERLRADLGAASEALAKAEQELGAAMAEVPQQAVIRV